MRLPPLPLPARSGRARTEYHREMLRHGLALLTALTCVAIWGTVAQAQGYTAFEEPESWRLEMALPGPNGDVDDDWTAGRRPDRAEALDLESLTVVPVGFPMTYYGERIDALTVSPHGWAAPGARAGLQLDGGADVDGVLAVFAGARRADRVWTWTRGEAPNRRLVIDWQFDAGPGHAQLHLLEDRAQLIVAYHAAPRTGDAARASFEARLDEPGGPRSMQLRLRPSGVPRSTLFRPRTVVFNPPDIGKQGVPARWLDVRKESTVPDGCTKRCTYLGRGRGYFHVPDRSRFWLDGGVTKKPAEFLEHLLAEDRATFGGESGDAGRWVRQVLDGKVLLLPADGSPPVRVWFRIIEYYSVDQRGTTLADHHVWNLRWILSNAFPGDDPREDIDRYYAWRATARARLSVGKLFRADQTDDAGKQYDSGRKNEYVLWSGRLKHGTRGALAPLATPTDGWTKFALMEDDMRVTQHADRDDLRFVPDPNYLDGHYEYVVDALDNPYGWITGRDVPAIPRRDESIDVDPGRESGPVTPR